MVRYIPWWGSFLSISRLKIETSLAKYTTYTFLHFVYNYIFTHITLHLIFGHISMCNFDQVLCSNFISNMCLYLSNKRFIIVTTKITVICIISHFDIVWYYKKSNPFVISCPNWHTSSFSLSIQAVLVCPYRQTNSMCKGFQVACILKDISSFQI